MVGDVVRGIIDIKSRTDYTIKETLNLVLEKLNQIYDNSYYSVKEILIGNGIPLKRYDFDCELINLLSQQGLIESQNYIGGNLTKLTPKGAIYVEDFINSKINLSRERNNYKEDSKNLTSLKSELNDILRNNEIEEILTRLQFLLSRKSSLNNDLILVSGRFYQNRNHELKNTLSHSELSIEFSRIREAILEIIDKLSGKDITN